MSIHAKLLAAQKAVHGIAKTGHNQHFNYKFFEEREVLAVTREALSGAGLAFIYSVEDATDREVETKNGRVEYLTDVRMVCTIYDAESGESLSGKAIGRGQDGQDKGINKAIVAGLKYWLLKTLMIPTEDDTERDENTNTEGNQRRAPREQPASKTPYLRPSSEPVGVKHDNVFDLDAPGGGPNSKAKGRSWRELLTTAEGRGYIKWCIQNHPKLDYAAKEQLQLACTAAELGDPDFSGDLGAEPLPKEVAGR